MIFLDIEVYPNYFLLALKGLSGRTEMFRAKNPDGQLSNNDKNTIIKYLSTNTTVGFNSSKFDLPILWQMCNWFTCRDAYELCKELIENNHRRMEVAPAWIKNHTDLYEVSPGVHIGLKLYGARMNVNKIQDLPFDPNVPLTIPQMDMIDMYCLNDLEITQALYEKLIGQIELRKNLSDKYKLNLLSKSDAQIAEAVLVKEIGTRIQFPAVEARNITYKPPAWINFISEELKELLKDIKNIDFTTDHTGKLKIPKTLENRQIKIGNNSYKIGNGGLHSKETCTYYQSDFDNKILDLDAASYYPSIMLNQKLYPPQCGEKFVEIYKTIVDRRLKAKKEGNKIEAESLKITINGTFGKLGSPYSKLYAPGLLIQVTITGQLELLMLVEMLELENINVLSANTDGISIRIHTSKKDKLNEIINFWEFCTNHTVEQTEYVSLCIRDVNNYFAIKTNGEVKTKGVFAEAGLNKNPAMPIIYKSVIEHIRTNKSLNELVRLGNISDYLTVRQVKGGGEYNGVYLGKVVRWYWSTKGNPITYVTNGNKVATSDGAIPLMVLPNTLPTDIDYDRYYQEAINVMRGLGYGQIT